MIYQEWKRINKNQLIPKLNECKKDYEMVNSKSFQHFNIAIKFPFCSITSVGQTDDMQIKHENI